MSQVLLTQKPPGLLTSHWSEPDHMDIPIARDAGKKMMARENGVGIG